LVVLFAQVIIDTIGWRTISFASNLDSLDTSYYRCLWSNAALPASVPLAAQLGPGSCSAGSSQQCSTVCSKLQGVG
jgi:hypothetical protein